MTVSNIYHKPSQGLSRKSPVRNSECLNGKGLTREEALKKVNAFFDAHQGAPTVDAHWDVKVEVFEGIQVEIKELKLVSVSIESK